MCATERFGAAAQGDRCALSVLAAEQTGRRRGMLTAPCHCCSIVAAPQPNEKSVVQEMFERETFRKAPVNAFATERKDKAAAQHRSGAAGDGQGREGG